MFLVLIKSTKDSRIGWMVVGDPFGYKGDAEESARSLAANASNTFAVVKVETMFRRVVTVTEVEIAP